MGQKWFPFKDNKICLRKTQAKKKENIELLFRKEIKKGFSLKSYIYSIEIFTHAIIFCFKKINVKHF